MSTYGVGMIVRQSTLEGEIVASPSKSQTHRALICASLAEGTSTIHNPLLCDDTLATIRACEAIGAKVLVRSRERIVIEGVGNGFKKVDKEIDCGESGSTLRFIAPVVSILDSRVILRGKSGLARRPMKELLFVLEELGARIELLDKDEGLPLRVTGNNKAKGKRLSIRGDISSQFISGLLFALPLLTGDSEISISTELESRDYVELTVDVLDKFGIKVNKSMDARSFKIVGGQRYSKAEFYIEGDYSSSSFLLVAGAISGRGRGVTISNLHSDSKQGDRRIVDILKEMGADVEVRETSVTVKKSTLRSMRIDAGNIPDLIPILAIASTRASGTSYFENVDRLRLKESDRVDAICKLLKEMGCESSAEGDAIAISGDCDFDPKKIVDFSDHRLVMAAVIGGLSSRKELVVENPTAIKKSYPDFFDHVRILGGDVTALSNSLGTNIRLSVYGESHGRRIGAILEGVPRGITIDADTIQNELEKRRSTSHLTTGRRESDIVEILSGVRENKTTGETLRLEIRNTDIDSRFYENNRNLVRPGHADFTAREKYASVFDYRGGGFLSGRMTACFVAAGAVAKRILEMHGISVVSHIVQIGKVRIKTNPTDEDLLKADFPGVIRCADPTTAEEMKRTIEYAREQRDSLGGIVECRVIGAPVGIGEPIFHSLEGELSQAMFSIPAVKGIEFGTGFRGAEMSGSENNDPFAMVHGTVVTITNNAGGILGGISNGMPLVFRVAIKPTSSIAREQATVDLARAENATISVKGRHDPCVAVRAPPVVESMAALTVADLLIAGGLIYES